MKVNTSFIPFSFNFTTDDVQEAGSVIATWVLIVAFFALMSFNEHGRSWLNMFWRDEYRTPFKPLSITNDRETYRTLSPTDPIKERREILKSHPFLTGKTWGGWFFTWINALLSLTFLVVMLIVTWYFYSQRSNGNFVEAYDYVALVITSAGGFWLFVLYSLCLADIWNKWGLGDRINNGTASDEDVKLATNLVTIDGKYMVGINSYTSVNIRWAIMGINCVIWGSLPFILSMFAVSWDRSPNVSWFQAIPNEEAAIVGTTGILLTLIWYVHTWKNVRNFSSYYSEDGYSLKVNPQELTPYEMDQIQVGLTSDTHGFDSPFKGRFPFQFCPEHYALARSIWTWSFGYCMYNDRLKALEVYLVCGALPLVLTYFAGRNVYYITYEGMCWVFFYLLNWLNQGTFFFFAEQANVNKNLITVKQSAMYSGMTPWNDWSTSIRLIMYFAFGLTIVSLGKLVSEPPLRVLPDKQMGFKRKEDEKTLHLLSRHSYRSREEFLKRG